MERKKIAGAFTHDHMLHYLQLMRDAYLRLDVPTFGIQHFFVDHEETQSGLGPLDDALYTHLLGAAKRLDSYLFILGDHGVNYGALRQSELGIHEEINPALWVLAPIGTETQARLVTTPML